mgnify:FL=1
MADGSAAELETQVLIAESVHSKIDYRRSKTLLEEVQKMLASMIRKVDLNAKR